MGEESKEEKKESEFENAIAMGAKMEFLGDSATRKSTLAQPKSIRLGAE